MPGLVLMQKPNFTRTERAAVESKIVDGRVGGEVIAKPGAPQLTAPEEKGSSVAPKFSGVSRFAFEFAVEIKFGG